MKLERNRAGNRYTFTPEDEKDEKFLDRIGKLEEENRKLKEELAHYKNTEAIQKSNNASRYNPYNNKSYVDREFNVIP